MDVYYSPESFGLKTVGEIEWSGAAYEFDLTVLWVSETGQLYWADDSGCSCPSPFESFDRLEDLSTGSFFDFVAHLEERAGARKDNYIDVQIAELITRARNL